MKLQKIIVLLLITLKAGASEFQPKGGYDSSHTNQFGWKHILFNSKRTHHHFLNLLNKASSSKDYSDDTYKRIIILNNYGRVVLTSYLLFNGFNFLDHNLRTKNVPSLVKNYISNTAKTAKILNTVAGIMAVYKLALFHRSFHKNVYNGLTEYDDIKFNLQSDTTDLLTVSLVGGVIFTCIGEVVQRLPKSWKKSRIIKFSTQFLKYIDKKTDEWMYIPNWLPKKK